MKSEPASFPEFKSGRFAVLVVELRGYLTLVDDPTVATARRTFDLIDAIPKIAKKHGGKALARAFGEMIYLWASHDGVGEGIGGAMRELMAAIRRVGANEPSQTPVYLVASEGDFFYQVDLGGTFINLLGPGMKRVGALGQMARSEKTVAMADRVVAEACPDLGWTSRPDGVFVVE